MKQVSSSVILRAGTKKTRNAAAGFRASLIGHESCYLPLIKLNKEKLDVACKVVQIRERDERDNVLI